MKRTASYWDKRALKRLTSNEKISEKYISNIKKIYERAYRNIDEELESIYKNYSKETGLDIQELKTLLTKSETKKTFDEMKRLGLDEYVKNNYKARISRLEQLQAQIYAKAKEIYSDEELEHTMCYSGVINNDYYRAIYDVQKGTGYNFSFNKIDNRLLDRVLTEKWSSKNYSQRIWKNTDILAQSVAEIVGGAILSGQGIEKTSRQIRERFDVGKYYATRLVRTETNYFNNMADAMAYEEMGIDKYVYVSVLDSRTSEMCQEQDGKVFKYSEKEIGVNFPPLHPNCRSTTRGYLGEEEEKGLQRRARNPITGQNEVIDNISYKDWMKQNNITEIKNGRVKTESGMTYNTKSFKGLDNKLVNTGASQLDKLIKKYPQMKEFVNEHGLIYGGSDRNKAIAYTRSNSELINTGIYLESDSYRNSKRHTKLIEKHVKSGHFMPCSEKYYDKYAVTHEFGHVTELHLLDKYNKAHPEEFKNAITDDNKWKNYREMVYNNIRKDIIGVATKNNPNFSEYTCLSFYGMSEPAEFFAECFANMECGKPNELGKAMKEYLKGVM